MLRGTHVCWMPASTRSWWIWEVDSIEILCNGELVGGGKCFSGVTLGGHCRLKGKRISCYKPHNIHPANIQTTSDLLKGYFLNSVLTRTYLWMQLFSYGKKNTLPHK